MQRPYSRRYFTKTLDLKDKYFGDFEYVVNRPEQPRLCFGSLGNRVTLPSDPKDMNSFMRRIAPTAYKNVGPGSHDDNRGAFYDLVSRKVGKLGLGSQGPRFQVFRHESRPAPYSIPEPPLKKNCAPFNSTSKRKGLFKTTTIPAPCDYLPTRKHKKLDCYCSFGGKKVVKCVVQVKCVPYNLDECDVCQCSCSQQGDYWQLNERFSLCRKDYIELFNHALARYKGYRLIDFKSVRDCFFAHEHHSCKAAVKIMSHQDIRKKIRKEAYLDLYIPQRKYEEFV